MAINPRIKQKAEDIRKKIFGTEVRESLASGIEAISEDVEATIGRQDYVEEQFQDVLDETTGKDVISAPELIAARNGKSNLKTRLDDEHAQVTAQLQQTELEVRRKRELEDFTPEVLAAIEGGGETSFDLLSIPQDNSVTPEKTTFAKRANLFNGDYDLNFIIYGAGQDISTYSYGNATNGISCVIELLPNTTYSVKFPDDLSTHDRRGVFLFDSKPVLNAKPKQMLNQPVDGMASHVTFSTNSTNIWLVVYVSSQGQKPPLMVYEGSEIKAFEGYNKSYFEIARGSIGKEELKSDVFDIADGTITTEKTNFAKKGYNLFNGEYVTDRVVKGSLYDISSYSYEYFDKGISCVIELLPNKTYSVDFPNDFSTHDRRGVFLFDSKPILGAKPKQMLNQSSDGMVQHVTFSTNLTDIWLVVYVSASGERPNLMISEGSLSKAFEGYNKSYFEIARGSIGKEELKSDVFDIALKDGINFVKPYINEIFTLENYGVYVEPYPFATWNSDIQYGAYDQLVSQYEFATRTIFAEEEISGKNIYRYDFSTPSAAGHSKPKIVLTHTHSFEKQSSVALYKLIKSMCDQTAEKELLQRMLHHYHIIVIPIMNPYGLDNRQRLNISGIDLNRNFPVRWEQTVIGSEYYSGTAPLQTNASIALDELMRTEENISFAVDVHNSGSSTTEDGFPEPFWLGTDDQGLINSLLDKTYSMQHLINKKYNPTNYYFKDFRVREAQAGGTSAAWSAYNIPAIICETKWRVVDDEELGQKLNVDVIGNAITAMMNYCGY